MWNMCACTKIENNHQRNLLIWNLVSFPKFCIDLHHFILWFQDSSLKKYRPVQLCLLVTLLCWVCKLVGCFSKAESVPCTDCTDTTKGVLCWGKVGKSINSNVKISYSCGASLTSREIYCLKTKTVFKVLGFSCDSSYCCFVPFFK